MANSNYLFRTTWRSTALTIQMEFGLAIQPTLVIQFSSTIQSTLVTRFKPVQSTLVIQSSPVTQSILAIQSQRSTGSSNQPDFGDSIQRIDRHIYLPRRLIGNLAQRPNLPQRLIEQSVDPQQLTDHSELMDFGNRSQQPIDTSNY